MLPSYFDYIFVHLRQKVRFKPKIWSTLGPNPTRKAWPDLQLWTGVSEKKNKRKKFLRFLQKQLRRNLICYISETEGPRKLKVGPQICQKF